MGTDEQMADEVIAAVNAVNAEIEKLDRLIDKARKMGLRADVEYRSFDRALDCNLSRFDGFVERREFIKGVSPRPV